MTSQLTLEEALTAVEGAADQRWMESCHEIIRLLAFSGNKFTTDHVWQMLEERGLSTKEPRAMGAAIRKLANKKVIVGTGEYWNSARPECHSRPVKVWVRA